jgi:hypothetical protein
MALSLSASHSILLPPGGFLILISVRGRFELMTTIRLERLGQFKISMTSSEAKPTTLGLVSYYLTELYYRVSELGAVL